MRLTRNLCAAALALCLSACLKVTGEAKDQFDLENEESSGTALIGTFSPFDSASGQQTTEQNSDQEASTDATNRARAADRPVDAPDAAPVSTAEPDVVGNTAVDPEEFAAFQEWKAARDNNTDEYREFLEYQEYKRWRESR